MRAAERFQGVLGGVAAGLAGGLFGVGGGIILVPLLTTRFHCTQHQAHGTSLAVIGTTAVAGVLVYAWHGQVAWITAGLVALSSALSARYGARLATRTPPVGLSRVFAAFLLLVAVRLLVRVPEPDPAQAAGWFEHGLGAVVFDLVLGVGVGILAGYMGVGGGILAVPAFTLVLGMTQQEAQGTSLAVILLTGPAGAFEHARHGNVVGRLVPTLVVGAMIGAPIASWLAQLVPHELLVRAFAIFLILNAVYGWLRAPARARKLAAEPSGGRPG